MDYHEENMKSREHREGMERFYRYESLADMYLDVLEVGGSEVARRAANEYKERKNKDE